jgi:glycyl-tRNA synthetase
VGCADRSCFDLTQHTIHSGVKLVAEKPLQEPKTIDMAEIQVDKSVIGKLFKSNAKTIMQYFENLSEETISEIEKKIQSTDR